MVEWSKFRFPMATLLGIFFACFGVFIFGKFTYVGLDLYDNVFSLMSSLDTAAEGFYQLFGSGFMVDLFEEFSPQNLQGTTRAAVFRSEMVWPAVITWIMTGFIAGAIVKGWKRGVYVTVLIVFLVFIGWVICGFFAGEDMSSIYRDNFTTRMSELFTAIVFVIPAGLIAGLITGPYEE